MGTTTEDRRRGRKPLGEIRFDTTKGDDKMIRRIVARAESFAVENGIDFNVLDARMDVSAIHLNGCPLKLAELQAAPDCDFNHDVFGIFRHIDRSTGALTHCFLPRYARSEPAHE